MKLSIASSDRDHAILVCDEANNDIAEFYHNEHATVGQSYETALALAQKLVTPAPVGMDAREALEAESPDVAEDDSDVLLAAHAIAEHGIGRSWDDFLPVNAHDVDHGDLIEYGRAAVAALRARNALSSIQPSPTVDVRGATQGHTNRFFGAIWDYS